MTLRSVRRAGFAFSGVLAVGIGLGAFSSAALAAAGKTGSPTVTDDSAAMPEVSGVTARARPAPVFLPEGIPERLDFDFGDFKGWLRYKGGWNLEGTVHHRGLRCGTYRAGLRFGAGNPGCENVQWLTEVFYATDQRQCNNASMWHSGGDINLDLRKDFGRITCAERIISCSGFCR